MKLQDTLVLDARKVPNPLRLRALDGMPLLGKHSGSEFIAISNRICIWVFSLQDVCNVRVEKFSNYIPCFPHSPMTFPDYSETEQELADPKLET